jgi:type IV fimbrial biogenesis protein FimT
MRSTTSLANGFTLIETMIGLALAAILLALAAPGFSEVMRNSRIRGQAETVVMGLQLARSEAIRSNASTVFAFTDATPTETVMISGVLPPVTPAVSGVNWVIYRQNNGLATPAWELVDSRLGTEATKIVQSASTSTITGTGAVLFDSVGQAQFVDSIGARSAIGSVAPFSVQPTGGESQCRHVAGGKAVCLRIEVTAGGSTRMCDPSVTAPDTRACR